MKTRQLGRQGLTVSELGLGCMGLSDFYSSSGATETQGISLIHRALALGVTFLDTADAYGPHTNERTVGKALQGRRDSVVLATKFGIVRDPKNPSARGVSGKPEYVRQSCEGSLRRLGVDTIDLYYQHRVDPNTPIEDTVRAMADLVKEGKVRYLGLSEASAASMRRAVKVHPIAALQTEYSLWTRDPEAEILPTCRELGITFVPYSPLGRGFLTGAIQKLEDLDPSDWRRTNPRFGEKALQENLKLAAMVKELASEKGATPAQLALAWVLSQGKDVVPIPGTKRVRYLEDNMGALQVKLTEIDRKKIAECLAQIQVIGERYAPEMMALVQRA